MKCKKENTGVFGLVVVAVVGLLMQACAVKKASLWPPSIEFTEGVDFHIGTNSIDSVNDNRGLGKERPVARY